MKTLLTITGLLLTATLHSATLVSPGLPISRYPNTNRPGVLDMFVIADTNNVPPTNRNVRFIDLSNSIASGLSPASQQVWTNVGGTGTFTIVGTNQPVFIPSVADSAGLVAYSFDTSNQLTTSSTKLAQFLNKAAEKAWLDALGSLGISSNLWLTGNLAKIYGVNYTWPTAQGSAQTLLTNDGSGVLGWGTAPASGFLGFESLTNGVRVGLSTNQNWTSWVTGQVSGATVILGVNGLALSNAIFVAYPYMTNQFTTNVPATPVLGGLWFRYDGTGLAGPAYTNGSRPWSMEYLPSNGVFRIGAIQAVTNASLVDSVGNTASFWDSTNTFFGTFSYGSNILNSAIYSVVFGINSGVMTNASWSTISGGSNNVIHTNASGSTISGGEINNIRRGATNGTIGGGSGNTIASGGYATTIGGGQGNTAGGSFTTIAGGYTATADAVYDFVGSGTGNTIHGSHSSIVGGRNNLIRGDQIDSGSGAFSFIGGGNTILIGTAVSSGANNAAIVGGANNTIAGTADNTFMGGGFGNTISTGATNAFIGGGSNNFIGVNFVGSAILAGMGNTVSAGDAFVIGRQVTNSAQHSVEIGFWDTNKIRIDTNFVRYVEMGTLYQSNVLAFHNPTAAQIGVGGFWVGNSNGTLVAIYTLNGTTTVMKQLAP